MPPASPGNPPNPGTSGALPCEVAAVLQQRCQSCHQKPPQFGAPMPLLTWSDTQVLALGGQMPVNEMMKMKIEMGKMPPPSTPTGPLSVEEKATLMAWLNSGAPKGSQGSCVPPGGSAPVPPSRPPPEALPCTPNHEFRASGATATDPFAVPLAGDTYRCFSFAVPFSAPEQAIAWSPIIDEARVVHHWILYGHTNNIRPVGCGDPGRVFLMGWAPGGRNGIMPDDVGLELPNPGSWLTLEVHYNNKAGFTDARDRSGVAMCTTDHPARQGGGGDHPGLGRDLDPARGRELHGDQRHRRQPHPGRLVRAASYPLDLAPHAHQRHRLPHRHHPGGENHQPGRPDELGLRQPDAG